MVKISAVTGYRGQRHVWVSHRSTDGNRYSLLSCKQCPPAKQALPANLNSLTSKKQPWGHSMVSEWSVADGRKVKCECLVPYKKTICLSEQTMT
jgi:hypothetical protein